MLPSNQICTSFSSEKVFNDPNDKNTSIKNLSKSLLNKKLTNNNQNIKSNIYNNSKSCETKYLENNTKLNTGKDLNTIEKNKSKLNQPQNKKNIQKNTKLNENPQKLIEQYKFQIQQLYNSLRIKEQEIISLKKELQRAKLNNIKKCFENLEINTTKMDILSKEIPNNEKRNIIKKNEHKIQYLDKMLVLNKTKKNHLKIESRDSIEIFQTEKPPLQAQITAQMQIEPLENEKFFQILDQFEINGLLKLENDLEIESRDSIEIFQTKKSPLKPQKVIQMLIERMILPDFLIQKIDNMIIMKDIKIYKIKNIIEERDSFQISCSLKKSLQVQHIENMLFKSIESYKNLIESNEDNSILNQLNNKKLGTLTNSIEHIPIKKSPLHLKNPEEIKKKYLKKYNSDNLKKFYYEKDDIQIDYIESVNICNINFKPKSNYIVYNSSNCYKNENLSLKPTLKVQNLKDYFQKKKNLKNHTIAEISYKNKKFINYNLITPKPTIQQTKKISKICNIEKVEKTKGKNDGCTGFKNKISNKEIIYKKHNNKEYNYKKLNFTDRNIENKYYTINNIINDKKKFECKNLGGRNVRIIKTQKHGPSIIEKKYIASSCEKYNNNYLTFKKKVINKNNCL